MLAAYGQENETVALRPPNYVNSEYGFGIALPDGYSANESINNGIWLLQIYCDMDEPMAQLSIEPLPSGVSDVTGFWQRMKERDNLMARNITYEKIDSIADTGAVQARVEKIENGNYILAITWVFVHDGCGFTLSGYPPMTGANNEARNIALEIAQQFRWMSDEEIDETEPQIPSFEIPAGREF